MVSETEASRGGTRNLRGRDEEKSFKAFFFRQKIRVFMDDLEKDHLKMDMEYFLTRNRNEFPARRRGRN